MIDEAFKVALLVQSVMTCFVLVLAIFNSIRSMRVARQNDRIAAHVFKIEQATNHLMDLKVESAEIIAHAAGVAEGVAKGS